MVTNEFFCEECGKPFQNNSGLRLVKSHVYDRDRGNVKTVRRWVCLQCWLKVGGKSVSVEVVK